jgi:hypothetical protein
LEKNRLQHEIRKTLLSERSDKWLRFIGSLNSRDTRKMWSKFREFEHGYANSKQSDLPNLVDNPDNPRDRARTCTDKATIFKNRLKDTFRVPNSPHFDDQHREQIETLIAENNHLFQPSSPEGSDEPDVTTAEVKRAVKELKSKSAPGPDGIHNIFIHFAPVELLVCIRNIFSVCVKRGHHPHSWKTGVITMLPKTTENRQDPNNYRPITLLNVIGKLLELSSSSFMSSSLDEVG